MPSYIFSTNLSDFTCSLKLSNPGYTLKSCTSGIVLDHFNFDSFQQKCLRSNPSNLIVKKKCHFYPASAFFTAHCLHKPPGYQCMVMAGNCARSLFLVFFFFYVSLTRTSQTLARIRDPCAHDVITILHRA